jgi:thioredoxin 1
MKIINILNTLFVIGVFTSISLAGTDNVGNSKFKTEIKKSVCKNLDNINFESVIAKGIVVVDFYADWCSPCQKLGPIFEQVASEMSGSLTFAKANVDIASKASQKYKVVSIPTLILFKDGKEIKRRMGGCDMRTLQSFIKED